ncbi:hypothetical protein KFK09_027185 [Dendrobium nobile]|uniref:Uncharacterized protein n=1 Tax=Dendrobium nobile TaxID=94219 RepID=A0A8T3A9W5_DENNO|nr:hypothetical protein KFK09_027185 [Dendrobium nobile]
MAEGVRLLAERRRSGWGSRLGDEWEEAGRLGRLGFDLLGGRRRIGEEQREAEELRDRAGSREREPRQWRR